MTIWSLRTRNERKEEELEEEQSHTQSRRAFWSAGQRQLWVGSSYMIPLESVSPYTIGIISEVPTKLWLPEESLGSLPILPSVL